MPTVPYTFTPHTTIESAKVNSNFAVFAQVLGLVGGTLTGTLESRDVRPSAHDTYSLGSASAAYRDLFITRALKLGDSNQSHFLSFVAGSNITANRTLTLTTGDADRTITLTGNPTLADWFDQSVKAGSAPTLLGTNITSIPEANITDGAILARVAADETISGQWTFTGATQFFANGAPALGFSETDQGSNLKNWIMTFENQGFRIQTRTDAFAALLELLVLDRSGNLALTGAMAERGRNFFMGSAQTRSFSAGNFTASGAMTWTVEAGDVSSESWRVVGDTLYYNVTLVGTVIGGTLSTALQIAIPGGFTAQEYAGVTTEVVEAGTGYIAKASVAPSGTNISITFSNGANHVAGTALVQFQIAFKVS